MKRSILLALTLSAVASCKKSSSSPAADTGKVQIDIVNTAYSQPAITVAAGTTVTWVNKDNMQHTVTATDSFFYSPSMDRDATFQHTFNTRGTYNYKCNFHSIMKGQVTVN